LTLVGQHDCFYTRIWPELTPIQQLALIAVVKQNGANLQSRRGLGVLRKAAMPPGDMGVFQDRSC
jgi:hypothetical protein